MMKRHFLFFCCLLTSVALFAQQENVLEEKRILYSLYEDYMKEGGVNEILKAEEISFTLRHRFDGLSHTTREGVIDVIISDVCDDFEKPDKTSFLSNVIRALFILPQDEPSRFDLLNLLADYYSVLNNKELLQATINQMAHSPGANTIENKRIIQDLQAKADAINPFPKTLNGYWIADSCMTDKKMRGRPWLILDIFSDNNGKWANISELSGISTNALEQKYSPMRASNSFYYDVRSSTFLFSFYNNNTRQGNAGLANFFYDNAQQTRAIFHSVASDTRNSIGQSVTIEFVGGLLGIANEAFARESATSRMSEDVMYITGVKQKDNVLMCNLRYQFQASNSASMKTTSQDYFNQNFTLYRWNKEDNIVFGLTNCMPISPYTIQLSPDMELYDIKKRTSFWNFQYGGVTILGIAAGALGTYYGIKALTKEERSDRDLKMGTFAIIIGPVVTISVPLIMRSIRLANREKAVGEYNMREYEKMLKIKEQ